MFLNPDNIPKEDLLDRKQFAEQIAISLVKTTEIEPEGFVTSLTGKWGSGKTSLLHYLKEILSSKCQESKINYTIIEFNPWVFADAENIKKTFLKEFSNQLRGKKRSFWRRVFKYVSNKLEYLETLEPLAGKAGKEFGKVIQDYIDSDSSLKIKKQIDKLLIKANKKIFVIIDDIDRLYPKQIFEILQILKLTCNFKNTYYIAAYDREAVEISIETQFHNYGKKYLDKIIQADFLIPEAPDEKIESIFFARLEALCRSNNITYSTSSLSSIWLHRGLRKYFSTLRDVYRYCNSLQFSLPTIPEDIDVTDFLVLEAIRLHDFEAYQKIQADYSLSQYTVGLQVKLGSNEHLNGFNNQITKKLIEYLFPSNIIGNFYGTKGKRLFDSKYFERYFTLKVSSKDITELEFKKFMHPDTNRQETLNNILELDRIDNLIIRLNDKEIYGQQKSWDFSLIKDLFIFFDANAAALTEQSHSLSDSIINLLSANKSAKDAYFNSFIDLLLSDTRKLDYAKIYFLHFMLLSKNRDAGFPNRAEDFKAFYLERHSKLESYYLKYLEQWKDYFMGERINEPFSFYTKLFIYDYAKYFPIDYQARLERILEQEDNLVFFLKNILSVSSQNEAHRIDGEILNLFLPNQYKTVFTKKIKTSDITKLTDNQKQWREFFLDHIKEEIEKTINFSLTSQPIINGYPDKDDHYYEKIFELDKYNYEIVFKSSIPMDHWRFGIKFSMNNTFPAKEIRHGSSYPIFHLEKNSDTNNLLKYSYYGKDGNQELGEPTTILNYLGEAITIRIYRATNNTMIDVVNARNESVIKSPIDVNGYEFFKVFAWADSRNVFKFDTEVIEIEKQTA